MLYCKIDTNALMEKMSNGEVKGPEDIQAIFIDQYGSLVLYITLAFTLPFLAWWLSRCWRGYALLKEGKSIAKPMSWI